MADYPDARDLLSSFDSYSLFEHCRSALAIVALDGRVLRVNRAFCRILGVEPNRLIGREIFGAVLSARDGDADALQQLTAGIIPEFVRERQPLDKNKRVLASLTLLRDEGSRPAFLLAQVEDPVGSDTLIHDLQERLKELTALHQVARLLHADQPPALVLHQLVVLLPTAWQNPELAGARISFDGAVYESTGFELTSVSQRTEFTASGKQGCLEITYRQDNDHGQHFLPEEKELLNSITEMLTVYLERAEARRRVEDVTKELLERNRDLWSLQQELTRVEQRAALGWMTGAIAHELGTPLNSVLGYTQLLAQEELPDKARRHVKTIASQVQRMTGIVQYYLDRTRGSTSKRQPVDVNALVAETLAWLKSVFEDKRISVVTNFDASLPSVNAHSGSLQRVIINLLNNAVAAIVKEGQITITTRTETKSGRDRGVIVQIRDTGSGIPADLLPRVFDVFMTTRADVSGTGLGLAVSQEIVKEHGGKITISSELQRGTTVSIFLPSSPAN